MSFFPQESDFNINAQSFQSIHHSNAFTNSMQQSLNVSSSYSNLQRHFTSSPRASLYVPSPHTPTDGPPRMITPRNTISPPSSPSGNRRPSYSASSVRNYPSSPVGHSRQNTQNSICVDEIGLEASRLISRSRAAEAGLLESQPAATEQEKTARNLPVAEGKLLSWFLLKLNNFKKNLKAFF